MKYDIDLFVKIINFIVEHEDEPELYIELQNNVYVDFTCYKDYIDAIISEGDYTYFGMSPTEIKNNRKTFSNIVDFLDNLLINGKSLHNRWNEVKYISDEGKSIDYTKEPEEQFLVMEGRIWYKPR